MEYIVILVDRPSDRHIMGSYETDNVKVHVIAKGQQMVGLRFKSTRPTLMIDCIKDRTLGGSEERFKDWWIQCVEPNAVNAGIIFK